MCAATAADSNDTLSVTVTDGLPFPLCDIGLVIPGARIVARTREQRSFRACYCLRSTCTMTWYSTVIHGTTSELHALAWGLARKTASLRISGSGELLREVSADEMKRRRLSES